MEPRKVDGSDFMLLTVHFLESFSNFLENEKAAAAAAADIIWDLASYKHLVSVVQTSGAIPVLVELLRDGSGDVKEKVSGAIAQFSYNKAGRLALADSGAIPIPIQTLEELRENAAEALDRLMQIRASDTRLDSSLRQLSVEHLTRDPSLT
ncbi:hypothetical protein ACH5RR_027791 [Cinchona calisaya]|uniref:Uncharacterized protein n=1 Tax=Cinchona calisaya TaxID=153742 RepID=A0ABD2YQY3_9GENT